MNKVLEADWTDAALRARVKPFYRGDVDFDEAVRFCTGEAFDGQASTLTEQIERLRHRVFSGKFSKQGHDHDIAELQRLESTAQGARENLEHALLESRRPVMPVVEDLIVEAEQPVEVAPPRSPFLRRAALLGAGIVIGVAGASLLPIVTTSLPNDDNIFDRQQGEADRAAPDLGSGIDRTSIHSLDSSGFGDNPDVDIFAARRTDDRVCLVVVHFDDRYSMSCAAESDFLNNGLMTAWRGYTERGSVTGTVIWEPGGALVTEIRPS